MGKGRWGKKDWVNVVTVHVVTGKLGQMSKGNMRRLETIKDKNI